MVEFSVKSGREENTYRIASKIEDITVDKYKRYVSDVMPLMPSPNADSGDDDAPEDWLAFAEWAVELCSCFSDCPKETWWAMDKKLLLGDAENKGFLHLIADALTALNDYENRLKIQVELTEDDWTNGMISKGRFKHKGIEYELPQKGFDDTKFEEFVKLQQLNEFVHKLQANKEKVTARLSKSGIKLKTTSPYDYVIGMLSILATPAGVERVGYNTKEIEKREDAFKDIPVYLLHDAGFFLRKIADFTKIDTEIYTAAQELARLKKQMQNTGGSTQF